MASLRREVMVPVPSYRRPSSLIGMSIALVLVASAVDAVVWTYQAKREAEEAAARERMRPVPVTWQEAPAANLAGEPSLVAPPPPAQAIRLQCNSADPLCGL